MIGSSPLQFLFRFPDVLPKPENAIAEFGKTYPSMIDNRHVDSAQDTIGHRAGSGDLQEMTTGSSHAIKFQWVSSDS